MESLDFRRTRSLYVNVRRALIYEDLSRLKGGAECAFSTSGPSGPGNLNSTNERRTSHERDPASGRPGLSGNTCGPRGRRSGRSNTYGKDFEQIEAFFGAERKLSAVLVPHVGKFFKSDALLKLPNGRERSTPTVEKTKRVLRMFLIWAKETGPYRQAAPAQGHAHGPERQEGRTAR